MQTPAQDQLRRAAAMLAPLVLFGGLAHLGYQLWKHWAVVTIDFPFFWLAGDMWLAGESPYPAAYASRAADLFGLESGMIWVYSPAWAPLAMLFASVDPLTGSRAWSVANAAMLLLASGLNVATWRAISGRACFQHAACGPIGDFLRSLSFRTLLFLHAGVMGMTQAAGNVIHLGQSSILVYLGASLVIFGLARGGRISPAIGAAIIMLKPQIGIPVCLALLFARAGRRALVGGAALSVALAFPAFLVSPPWTIIADMKTAMSQYYGLTYNIAPTLTGPSHILWVLTGKDIGGGAGFAALFLFVVIRGAGRLTRKRMQDPAVDAMIAIAAAAALAPLHVYDFVFFGAVALPALARPGAAGWIALAAFAIAWRAGNLPQPPTPEDITYYPGALWASLAALAIFSARPALRAAAAKEKPARLENAAGAPI